MEQGKRHVTAVVFAKSLYLPEAVQAAADAFSEFATFSVANEEAEVLVSASNIQPSLADVLLDEFCNYALHETIVRSRQ